jgi:flagellar motor switch protein FliM
MLAQHLPDGELLILLDEPEGLTGALAMDRALMVALIQQQTMGQVLAATPDERPFTATDAAMVAPLVDATLKRAAKLAEIPLDAQCLTGFRFGARVEDRRAALLTLDSEAYRVFDLTLELDGGPLQGELCLMLPEPELPAMSGEEDPAAMNAPNLGQAIGTARAELTAVLSRIRIPLAELSEMRPGELLPLVQERLDRVELVSISGDKVAIARLGQAGGLRALRLNESRLPLLKTRNEFATGVGAKSPVLDDPMTVEGHLIDSEEPEYDAFADQDVESIDDDSLAELNPQEAVEEITALAGLESEQSDSLETSAG